MEASGTSDFLLKVPGRGGDQGWAKENEIFDLCPQILNLVALDLWREDKLAHC